MFPPPGLLLGPLARCGGCSSISSSSGLVKGCSRILLSRMISSAKLLQSSRTFPRLMSSAPAATSGGAPSSGGGHGHGHDKGHDDHGHDDHGHARTPEEVSAFVKKEMEGHWQDFGFFPWDKVEDRRWGHQAFFCAVGFIVVPAFLFYYLPDPHMTDWVQREAFLVLREREAAGVIPISKDFIDPATFELPSDEELGDTEIVV